MNQRRADYELLRSFARAGDQQALADVIRRHLDLVYATALRKVGDAGAAEEIAQNVFTVLARKAWQFAPDDSLPAWLHRTTLLECQSWLRGELRRRRREQTAAELGTTMKTPDEQYAFRALVPLLDEALLSLREKDRTALLLRFYESHSLRDVGAVLGVGEDAAQKRVAGAVEKLAQFFQRRGFKTATLAATMAALRGTATSASAVTVSNVTRVALQTAPPTFAGLFALVAILGGFTRIQKSAVIVTTATIVAIWVWIGISKSEKEALPTQTAAAVPPQSETPGSRANFFQRTGASRYSAVTENTTPAERYIEITGKIEVTSYPGGYTSNGANARPPKTISFVCVTGTNQWRIDHDFSLNSEQHYFFDGTNVYSSARITKPLPEHLLTNKAYQAFGLAIAPSEESRSNVTINIWQSHNGHPLGDPGVNLPWLAFCSGNFLRREGRLIPLPDDNLRHTPDRFAYTDRTETFDDELGLPRTIDLFTSKSLYQSSVDDFYKEWFRGDRYMEWTKRTAESLEEGVLTFHYAVVESTNFLGWNLPTKFEYFQTERKYVQNADWFHRGLGRVTSIRLSTKPENAFVPGMRQTIVDSRFRDDTNQVSTLIYTTTNSFAGTTNDPALQEEFAERVTRMKRGP